MRLTVANLSTIPQGQFQGVLQAIARQVAEDFSPEWKVQCTLRAAQLSAGEAIQINGVHDAIIYVGDDSQDPTRGIKNALGYHSVNHQAIPYGFVYLDVCK